MFEYSGTPGFAAGTPGKKYADIGHYCYRIIAQISWFGEMSGSYTIPGSPKIDI